VQFEPRHGYAYAYGSRENRKVRLWEDDDFQRPGWPAGVRE
jgi:hypothetical protein